MHSHEGVLQLELQLKLQHRCFPTFITSAPRARARLYEDSLPRLEGSPSISFPGADILLISDGDWVTSQPRQQRPRMLWLSKTALTHVLIISPRPSLQGWASQSVYMEKRSPGWEDVLSIAWPNQRFVFHVNGSPRFVRKWIKSWLSVGSLGRRITRGNVFFIKTGREWSMSNMNCTCR